MNDVILLLTQQGAIIGQVINRNLDNEVELANPVLVNRSMNQVMFVPLLDTTEETSITVSAKDCLFGFKEYTPIPQVAEQYRQMFSKIVAPQQSIISPR